MSKLARLAQSVENKTLNLRVVGLSPTLGACFWFSKFFGCFISFSALYLLPTSLQFCQSFVVFRETVYLSFFNRLLGVFLWWRINGADIVLCHIRLNEIMQISLCNDQNILLNIAYKFISPTPILLNVIYQDTIRVMFSHYYTYYI